MFTSRKRWMGWLLAAAVATGGAFVAGPQHRVRGAEGIEAAAPLAEKVPLVRGVVKVGMTVSDLDRSVAFFRDVLLFERISEREVMGKPWEQLTGVFGLRCRIAVMKLGDEELELTEYVASPGRPYPSESRSNDRWFQHIAIITSDMDAAFARLRANKVRFGSTGPQTLPEWNANAAGIKAFYFRDPDGHVLEVLQFPKGKGQERWQGRERLFLGIDHTAIVVQDTEKSLAFYRDVCGMTVAGEGENYGDEQEHLNNVEGARLRITTLRAAAGPAVELLEYLAPRDGRPFPADAKPNDILHWQTAVQIGDVSKAFAAFSASGTRALSPSAVNIEGTATFILRDPDGHALQVIP